MKYSKDLDYFIGKPCTIIVRDINWHYTVESMMDYFMGVPYVIGTNHVWMEHLLTGSKNCICMDQIVAISEEQFVPENHPEGKKLIEEYKQKNPVMAEKTTVSPKKVTPQQTSTKPSAQGFVDIEELMKMSGSNRA